MDAETNFKRLSWKLKKHVAKLILNTGGIIFGGYVRDAIIHDHYSDKYYTKCSEDMVSSVDIISRYNDETFYPEYKERMLIPEDIDCFFKTTQTLNSFEQLLFREKFCLTKVFTRKDAMDYIPRLNVPANSLSHIRYKITHLNSNKSALIRKLLQQSFCTTIHSEIFEEINYFISSLCEKTKQIPEVYIDVLLQTNNTYDFHPPFGGLDFECNGLVLSNSGISLASDLKESQISFGFITDINKMTQVISDILAKKAVLVKKIGIPTDTYRFDKMRIKGWDIITGKYSYIETNINIDSDDICIICHGQFNEEQDKTSYKLKCCSAKYHKKCLIDAGLVGPVAMTVTSKCIMCKKTIPIITNDICILQALPT